MAIHTPGERFRYSKFLRKRNKGKRSVVAVLSLTAMVDMFTVLVVFLLQNYNTTGAVIYLPKEVQLPKATTVKELKPAHVVTIGPTRILLEDRELIDTAVVVSQENWMIEPLYLEIQAQMQAKKAELQGQIGLKVKGALAGDEKYKDKPDWRKVTVQADKGIDFLTVKKVMFTISQAGASEINFAVMQQKESKE